MLFDHNAIRKFGCSCQPVLTRDRAVGERIPVFLFSLFAVALLTALPASAATITVTNTNDSGAGSLRDAIATAGPGNVSLWAASVNQTGIK